ncbi:uncharacterized protein LOC116338074 [Contarinia nasturtii]|uniref:uncharacterized protein LOC116338074 n=1 Tax=Contarinia nasturtii TaxID=265458 RepID=UPI0012D38B87|nr:uncharacterized protein LOC116338074 [Contarinia nasturtii]XP_031618991.1 uncharacterized protein LOC116338074 [Contarinia nasturtii]
MIKSNGIEVQSNVLEESIFKNMSSNNHSTPIKVVSDKTSENQPNLSNQVSVSHSLRLQQMVNTNYNDSSKVENNNYVVIEQYSELEPIQIDDEATECGDIIEISDDSIEDYSQPLQTEKGTKMNDDKSLSGFKVEGTAHSSNQAESKELKMNRQIDASGIDYMSWQWQPHLKLTRMKPNDLAHKSRSKTSKKVKKTNIQATPSLPQPIEFHSDESIIRELSPRTANERFQKRIEEIKMSMQPIHMAPRDVNRKRPRFRKPPSAELLEYEEVQRRLREKKPKRRTKRSRARKLYNPNALFEETSEKENSDYGSIEPKTKRPRSSLQPTRILPERASKTK